MANMPREPFRIVKEGSADEMERNTAKMTQETRQQRLEDRSISQKTLVEKLCADALSNHCTNTLA